MTPALAVENLTMGFGKTNVFHDLSFCVNPGDSLAVIGPNGCGKTVLFKALVGSLPYQGKIEWAPGTRIGYVPQKLDLERDLPLTGSDLLAAKAHVNGSQGSLEDLIHRVDLDNLKDTPIGALSGGQFQRLLFALALIGDPNVLLLDEPTAGVDQPGQDLLNTLIQKLQRERGLTVLFISHELSVVFLHATNVLCFSRERAWFGPPKKILTPANLEAIYGTPVEFHVHDR